MMCHYHERVDQHRAVALREEAQRLGVVVGEDAHVEEAHVLHQRQLEVQAGLGDHVRHLAELKTIAFWRWSTV